MNVLAIYVGFSMLFIAYIMQLMTAANESSNTPYKSDLPLSDYVFGNKGKILRHWPFFGITILFPFCFSVIPILVKVPSFEVAKGATQIISVGQIFLTLTSFAKNYLIVLITLEFGLLYGFENLTRRWKRLLLVATALDIIMYLLLTYIFFKIEANLVVFHQMSWMTVAFLLLGCLASFLATLYVVISVTLLNEM